MAVTLMQWSLVKRSGFSFIRCNSCFFAHVSMHGAPVPAHARGFHLLQVYAVFGFCDIRQFTDATEVLQEDVMEFVNSISKIVHMEVSLHGGFPNKNIGDAFLLVCVRPPPSEIHMFGQLRSEWKCEPTLDWPPVCTYCNSTCVVLACVRLIQACLSPSSSHTQTFADAGPD